MNRSTVYTAVLLAGTLFNSCRILEKSSQHGFDSGYYKLKQENKLEDVYVNISDQEVSVYPMAENAPDSVKIISIPLALSGNSVLSPVTLSKNTLDIDITTILFKYRSPQNGIPVQMTTDFNAALYAGWRHDNYHFLPTENPLGTRNYVTINRGYDFGVFAGPGATLISPFTTRNKFSDEYNGMIIQFGIAGIVESNVASFGVATGFDYLLSPNRNIWIYNKKPWIGFIVGIALN
jgi:hypothetical protein